VPESLLGGATDANYLNKGLLNMKNKKTKASTKLQQKNDTKNPFDDSLKNSFEVGTYANIYRSSNRYIDDAKSQGSDD
jgi:peptide methionine sulfoxide reductase MsrB